MSCSIPSVGAKIITLAIVTHGNINKVDLDPTTQQLFDNVRLFSKAGGTQCAITTPGVETYTLDPLYERFKINLNSGKSTLQIMQQYAKDLLPKYGNLIKFMEGFSLSTPGEVDVEKSCKIYNPVTFDKQFIVEEASMLDLAWSYI
jgi:hypothetical protein